MTALSFGLMEEVPVGSRQPTVEQGRGILFRVISRCFLTMFC